MRTAKKRDPWTRVSTLDEAENAAKSQLSPMMQFPDGWELMVWYAPTAGSEVIRVANGGFGYMGTWIRDHVFVGERGRRHQRENTKLLTRTEAEQFIEEHNA